MLIKISGTRTENLEMMFLKIRGFLAGTNYKLYHALLKQGGIFILFDDFEGESIDKTKLFDDTWDEFVAKQFSDMSIMDSLANKSQSMHDKIEGIYSNASTETEKIKQVRDRRISRREYCLEEIRPFSQSVSELKAIFGEDKVQITEGIIPELPQFKMITATKL